VKIVGAETAIERSSLDELLDQIARAALVRKAALRSIQGIARPVRTDGHQQAKTLVLEKIGAIAL
jgi:hypothetical protein